MVDDPERKTAHFRFHPNLIDRLGSGLYDTSGKAIAELIANAHDANAKVVRISYPKRWTRRARIAVEDGGDGMSPDQVERDYLWVAMNRKVAAPRRRRGAREPVGELGIGKFAGLGIARRMVVRTRRDGVRTALYIDRRELDPEDLGKSGLHMEVGPDPERGHGTTLELTGLSSEIVPLTEVQLREELSSEFAQIPDFSIYVNGTLVEFGFRGEVREKIPIAGTVRGHGRYKGEVLIAKRPKDVQNPGLVVLGRGRRLDGPTLFGLGAWTHGGKMYAYVTGWVRADWLVPTSAQASVGKRSPVITGRATLLKERPGVKKFYEAMKAELKQVQARVAELLRGETEELLQADKELMAAFGNPTIPVDATTRRFMGQVAKSLGEYRPRTRIRVVRKLREFIEVGEHSLAIRAIREADPRDVKSMERLLRDLTLKEVVAIAWEARKRYEAILQLRRMTKPGLRTLEPVIQKFLEERPWFLQEGYDRYLPNRRLKQRIEHEVHDKPDHLFVRELGDHIVIVELKRMGKDLVPDHAMQAQEYRRIALRTYKAARVEVWLIGEKTSAALQEDIRADHWVHVTVRTYDELLRETERRYRFLLRHLPEEAAWVKDYEPGHDIEEIDEEPEEG